MSIQNEIQEYLCLKRELYNSLLFYIEDEGQNVENYFDIVGFISFHKINEKHSELKLFLNLLIEISSNHHRNPNFFEKISNLFLYLEKDIKQQFSNLDIFKLCQKNILILLFIINKKIIYVDENIANLIFNLDQKNGTKYYQFFYPEIKQFLNKYIQKNIEKELLLIDSNIFDNFQAKRELGENDNYICSLIRNDYVEEFIRLINYRRIPLSKYIEPSLFETNDFLLKNKTTLIEYAAFYGSIQIFKFLLFNDIELKPSLWLYAIHSNNADLIHLLEEYNVEYSYEICFSESIKCHHNDIADYILYTYLNNMDIKQYSDKTIKRIMHHYNFNYFPIYIEKNNEFFYSLFKYDYTDFVKLYLNSNENLMIRNKIFYNF